jgi:hypothetical protein
MAGIVGLWVYVEPIAARAHVAPALVDSSIAGSLIAQVVGAVAIALVINRIRPNLGIFAVTASYLLITAIFDWGTSDQWFVITTIAFGVLWSFAMAMFLPLLFEVDPSRQSAMFLAGTMLLGSSAGPLFVGAFTSETNIEPALVVSAILFVLSSCACIIATRFVKWSKANRPL